MCHQSKSKKVVTILLSILVILFIAACAAKRSLWGDIESGLILQYRMPQDQTYQYRTSNSLVQSVEVMGQAMETKINTGYVFTVKSKGMQKNHQQLSVTIDSMQLNVNTPQGDLTPDLNSIMGKSFDLRLSNLGRELDLSGAEKIKYKLGPGGQRNIVSDFKALFPDLAGRPVKIGDTWTSRDTIHIKDSNSNLTLLFESLNTLQGLETVDGQECAKVSAEVTGTLEGSGKQGPADLTFNGNIKATDTWFFAYKKGHFVHTLSKGSTEGQVSLSAPQNMTIPMTMKTKFETKLIK